MRIQGIYAAIAAADMAASEDFYTKLFGRGPDDRPMDNLIQWRNVAGANIQVFVSPANAGASLATIVVPDMDEARTTLSAAGISLSEAQQGDYGRIAHVSDPAGNKITLAEPPSAAASA